MNRLQRHSQAINAIAISPDGKTRTSGSDDSTIRIWSSEGKLVSTLDHHQDRVTALSFSPDNKFIVSASADKTIKL
ncbi:MAG: hypothetical protein HRU34_10915 [Richelia sp.]|nr:hypothetical protein [Richelia sp.]